MAGYSSTPFIKKMGIQESMRAILLNTPKEARTLFNDAPVKFVAKLAGNFDYIHLFTKTATDLKRDFPRAKKFLKLDGLLWISWPKAGKLGTDINENIVRDIGLANGLVDVKVAAVNETWSGLKFVYRLKDR